jgi:hypothetical protein
LLFYVWLRLFDEQHAWFEDDRPMIGVILITMLFATVGITAVALLDY